VLPTEFVVARTMEIPAPPEAVFPHVADLRAWAHWDPWKRRDPSVKSTYREGPTDEVGAWETWRSDESGEGRRVIRELEPLKKVRINITHGDGEDAARMELHLQPTDTGTSVLWTMSGDTGKAPVSRWIGVMMDVLAGPDLEAGLRALKTAVTQPHREGETP
jgi:hypothetical protein